ncbi:Tetratricopeptide repeat protein 27 [Lamellibrachia satsuma]|nr:Tetratricopeptide repeat protein 27 [Lamellibrachia satsuma]
MDQDPVSLLPEAYRQDEKLRSLTLEYVKTALGVDGESIYGRTRYPIYLFLASTLLDLCRRHVPDLETVDWWQMRCAQIHQALLQERSPTLKTRVQERILTMHEKNLISGGQHRELAVQFHLEAGHLCYFYYEVGQASDHITQAESLSGLQINLTGALGKRTCFQENDISQLVLEVRRSPDDPDQSPDNADIIQDQPASQKRCLPKDLNLDDDTVMEHITLKEGEEVAMVTLSGVEQAVVLAHCYQIRKSHEEDGKITQEESLAYITGVLSQPVNWCIETKALLMRTYWEQGSSRRMERSIKQLEELVNQFRRPEPCAVERLHLLYCVQLPPLWVVQRDQAELFQEVGMTKAALDIYLRLQMWEEVIQCFASLGRREKAERIIREQLAKRESPLLWCYLGDVTRKKEHYVKAWELSGSRFARAQKALGYWYLQRGKYEDVLPCFEKSLEINPLQVGVWFSYGCAALAAQQFPLAATAFRRCVNLNADVSSCDPELCCCWCVFLAVWLLYHCHQQYLVTSSISLSPATSRCHQQYLVVTSSISSPAVSHCHQQYLVVISSISLSSAVSRCLQQYLVVISSISLSPAVSCCHQQYLIVISNISTLKLGAIWQQRTSKCSRSKWPGMKLDGPRAFLTYQEALRCEYENWRIWENYLLVGIDCGEFQEVIRAYHRILDLSDRHTDVTVLGVLVKAVCEDLPDAKDQPASYLLTPLRELFGRLTSKVHSNADIWRLYSQLSLSGSEVSQNNRELALQYQQKAHRCTTQASGWERKLTSCVDIVQESIQLVDAYMECIEGVELTSKIVQMLSSAKLAVKSVLATIKKQHKDAISNELPSDLQAPCDDLETRLTTVTDKINSLQ